MQDRGEGPSPSNARVEPASISQQDYLTHTPPLQDAASNRLFVTALREDQDQIRLRAHHDEKKGFFLDVERGEVLPL